MSDSLQIVANIFTILLGLMALVGLLFHYFNKRLSGHGEDYLELRESLASSGTWPQKYRRELNSPLSWLDRHLIDHDDTISDGFLTKLFGYNPWTARGLDMCLRLAAVYPVFSLILIWALWGENTSGVSGLLPGDLAGWQRGVVLLAMCVSAFGSFQFLRTDGRKFLSLYAVAAAFAGVVAVAGVVAAAFAGAGPGAGAVAFVVIWSYRKSSQFRKLPLFYAIFIPGLLAVALAMAEVSPAPVADRSIFVLLMVYLAVLPVINAVLDWLSLGFTRGLLQAAAVRAWSPLWVAVTSLLDLAASFMFLTGLAVAMTAMLAVMNNRATAATGAPLLDLASIFARLRHNPWDPGLMWVYFTLFSTFLPTLMHLGILVSATTIAYLPGRATVLTLMEQGMAQNYKRRLKVVLWFMAQRSFFVLAPLMVLGLVLFLLWYYLPGLGGWLLYLCEWLNWLLTGETGIKPTPPTGILVDV